MISLSRTIKDLAGAIQTIKSRFSQTYNANPGDILRTDATGKLSGCKLIQVLRAGGTAGDITQLSTSKVSMQEMFSSWDRISCDGNGNNQNATTSEHVLARASYYYDAKHDVIICSRNSDAYSAFISNEEYGNDWTLEYRMDQRYAPGKGGDNDLLQFIIAYMVDSAGKFHTLSINRRGPDGNFKGFTLAYDLYDAFSNTNYNNTTIILGESNTASTTWNNNYTKIKVVRTPTSINAYTADPNQNTYNSAYNISWTLPTTKPNDWSNEAWKNINHMMSNRSKVGFGTQSNISAFKVDSQINLFDEIVVYNLSTGYKETYKEGTKIKSESCDISLLPNTIIYSSLNNKLFYYRGNGSCTELLSRDAIEAELLTIKNNLAQIALKVDPKWTWS